MTMDKITSLTDDMYNKIKKGENLDSEIKKFLGIPEVKEMLVGDSMVSVRQASNTKDVFKCTQNEREIFYVVIKAIDSQMAFCYSIYPC